ncbi:MAG: hypothetical protein R2712_08735 [Vicinamibacterales bacterium]
MPEHGHVRAARRDVLVGAEEAAVQGAGVEELEIGRADGGDRTFHGRVAVADRQAGLREDGHRRQRPRIARESTNLA